MPKRKRNRAVAIIPARYGSTRFEGKPLVDLAGKPLVQWVYEGVVEAKLLDDVLVATDDERIYEAVKAFGGKAVMTSPLHRTGTDRVAEVAQKLKADVIVNVQGDEPLIKGTVVDRAVRALLVDPEISMATLMTDIGTIDEWMDPNVAKVVVDRRGFALYFSRSPIPLARGIDLRQLSTDRPEWDVGLSSRIYKHIGLYVFRRDFLLRFAKLKQTPLEKIEQLEQLRALENGFRIKVIKVDYNPQHVETPADLPRVIAALLQRS